MKLKDLVKNIEIIETKGDIDYNLEISDISYNSKNSTKDSAFVAVIGQKTDGHKYIKNAIENGASIAFVEYFTDDDIAQLRVSNSRKTLADLSNEFFKNPSLELNCIGITATNGKTTTTFMIDSIFKKAGISTGLIGTEKIQYKDTVIPTILTTPESRDLQEYTRSMVDEGVTDLIMEVSSHAQEMSRIKNMDYDIVAFNNISREHIDQHGNFENYSRIKSGLIKNAKSDAFAILNFDFPFIKNLKDNTKANVLSYSLENNDCMFGIANLDLTTGFAKYTFKINREIDKLDLKVSEINIELGASGYSSVMNSVVAIIVALIRKIDISIIQDALKEFNGVPRRFQMIYDKEFKVIDDHFANPKNIAVTMETLSKMDYKKIVPVYAIRGSRGENLIRECTEEFSKWIKDLKIDEIISTESSEVVTEKDFVTDKEREAFLSILKENNIKVNNYKRLDVSIKYALEKIEDGDLLLLLGCQGMDNGSKIFFELLNS